MAAKNHSQISSSICVNGNILIFLLKRKRKFQNFIGMNNIFNIF